MGTFSVRYFLTLLCSITLISCGVGDYNVSLRLASSSAFKILNETYVGSFGTNGFSTYDLGGQPASFADAFFDSENNIYVMGSVTIAARSIGVITKLDSSGDLDTSFGTSGLLYMDPDPSYITTSVAQIIEIDDENFYVIGLARDTDYYTYISKISKDGVIDTTFGVSGFNIFEVSADDPALASVIVYPTGACKLSDGSMIVTGELSDTTTTGADTMVFKINSDGTYDSATGVINEGTVGNDFGRKCIELADGKIVLSGYGNYALTGYLPFIIKYNSDLTRDTTFGTGGRAEINGFGFSTSYRPSGEIIFDSSGRILGGGWAASSTEGGQAGFGYRLTSAGVLDTSFSDDGILKYKVNDNDRFEGVAVQSDDKVLFSGHVKNGTTETAAIFRYNSDGTLDTSFGTDGVMEIYSADATNIITKMTWTSTGKLLILGRKTDTVGDQKAFIGLIH